MNFPSSGPQGNYIWPHQGTQQSVAPIWSNQPYQPCWPCQPNQANWPGMQPTVPNWPAYQPAPPTQSIWPNLPTMGPSQPTQPISPSQPVPPSQPNQSVPPSQPVQPNQPTQLVPPSQAISPNMTPQLPNTIPSAWRGNPGQSGWPNQGPTGGQEHIWPPVPPTGPVPVPFNMNLPRGIYDKLMFTIRGQVKPDAKMFTINFLRGNDIAFHINPRFNEGGKQVLVRNHQLGNQWGQEERTLLTPFPFAAGQYFEMKILCTVNEFRVTVNNTPVFEFKYRIREVNQLDRVNILHDVNLFSVSVDTLS